MQVPSISTTLCGNAIYAILCLTPLVLFPQAVADFLGGFPVWINYMLAAGLLVFAIAAALTSRTPTLPAVRCLFAADLAWLLATPVLMVAGNPWLNLWGQLVLINVALLVSVFAWLEWQGMRELEAISS